MSRSSTTRKRATKRKKQHLKIANEPELDFAQSAFSNDALSEDLEGQAQHALKQIEEMRRRQIELSRHREELEEINLQKQEFLASQGELSDKMAGSVSLIEREIFEMKQEIEDLQRTRDCFALHMENIEALDYRSWKREELATRLSNALSIIDHAEDDYDQAVDLFRGARSTVFQQGRRRRSSTTTNNTNEGRSIAAGIAFHAPLLLLGAAAIFIYIIV